MSSIPVYRPDAFIAANRDQQKAATTAFRRACRSGEVTPQPCAVCGAEKTHGHHEDYALPLDVVWLCPLHHRWRHRYAWPIAPVTDSERLVGK